MFSQGHLPSLNPPRNIPDSSLPLRSGFGVNESLWKSQQRSPKTQEVYSAYIHSCPQSSVVGLDSFNSCIDDPDTTSRNRACVALILTQESLVTVAGLVEVLEHGRGRFHCSVTNDASEDEEPMDLFRKLSDGAAGINFGHREN